MGVFENQLPSHPTPYKPKKPNRSKAPLISVRKMKS